jgi:hypothetical protein
MYSNALFNALARLYSSNSLLSHDKVQEFQFCVQVTGVLQVIPVVVSGRRE